MILFKRDYFSRFFLHPFITNYYFSGSLHFTTAMKKFCFVTLILCAHLLTSAQPGAVDLTFDPGTAGPDNFITDMEIQPDGKILTSGAFYYYVYNNDTIFTRLVRLNKNGSLDTTFHATGPDYMILDIALQSDGKIILGGEFSSYEGMPFNNICRLNADGSLDTTFHIGTGFNARVLTLQVQPDGKILAGGWFTAYNGVTCKRLARLNADGSYDLSFNTVNGASSTVEDIELQNDGKILIAGDFTSYDTISLPLYGTNCWRVARVNPDGSRDTSFVPKLGAHKALYALALRGDGKVFIGGNFDFFNFQSCGRIARLNANGDLDGWFQCMPGANDHIYDIEVLSDDKVLVAGSFTSYGGTAIQYLVKLHPDGAIDTTFRTGQGPEKRVYDIAVQRDGKILIAGLFDHYDVTYRKLIARLYNCLTPSPGPITGSDSTLCPGEVLYYSVAPDSTADSYRWSLPAGWAFSADSTSNSITVISNGQGGMVSVQAFSDSCGYSNPQTKNINRIQPPPIPICLVTVDDSSTHNVLIWEKPADRSLIDSFFIYREATTGIYTKIAAFQRDSLSEFHDYGADPNTTSYRYKMSVLDTCGVESELSLFHNTIHLQNLGSGNFQWTFYQIENSPNPVISFNVNRDDQNTGNFQTIGLVPGTNSTFTDVNYFSFPDAQYVVDVNWMISCTPQRGTVNTTRSNIRGSKKTDTNIGISPVHAGFQIYPNPTERIITLRCSFPENIQQLRLLNMLGQPIWSEERVKWNYAGEKIIDAGALAKGVYFLSIETNVGRVKRKVFIR
ncbi:MAG TPA: T9SS type A sorting domain-containing protein [Chitinophagales bacterium]|nr:T9SS type A sorting domain-containing protein [Chitinophagales bacterium]